MFDDEETEKENIDIEIVTGDGKNLEISPVYDHVKIDKHEHKDKNTKIIIPKEKNSNED